VAARVIIVDYMSGNLHSIRRCLQRIKTEPVISADPSEIDGADKLILPGVGHFGQAIAALHFLNLFDALNKAVLVKQVPILGICLGMEVMGRTSEEGNAAGSDGLTQASCGLISRTNSNLRFLKLAGTASHKKKRVA